MVINYSALLLKLFYAKKGNKTSLHELGRDKNIRPVPKILNFVSELESRFGQIRNVNFRIGKGRKQVLISKMF